MKTRIRALLETLYDPTVVDGLERRIEARLSEVRRRPGRSELWSESDVLLISYADSIRGHEQSPISSLRGFLQRWMSGLITHVHLLPFFPFTSDDGFAVSDYLTVAEDNGTWADITALSKDVELVFDLVINHASSAHLHFQEFLEDREPGRSYFFTASAEQDVSAVTRPRATPLLQAHETPNGVRHVWSTFSRDQVDWDFSNPDVLYMFLDIFITYIERGASWMRLDAIAYLWKEVGTSCVHLPQTHAVVQLLRAVAESISSDIKILTETNVPLAENLSYFGAGDEAHIVYNFSLPPLLVHALLTGEGDYLTRWCQSLPELASGCTYLNFTASHDGIGLRPAEGILGDGDRHRLVDCVRQFGGRLTERRKPDGSLSPYEANISLFDALKGTVAGQDDLQVERFLVSQGVMLSLQGVPALYYNSLLAAPNNLGGLKKTGRNRTINRKKWTLMEIEERLQPGEAAPWRVLQGLKAMMEVRRNQPCFHPEAPQEALSLHPRIFALRRDSVCLEQTVLCLFNISAEDVEIDLPSLGLGPLGSWSEIYGQRVDHQRDGLLIIRSYGLVWLEALGDQHSDG
mgnify:CR=1 FL=1